ncbi:hypothetical protein EMM73_19650 [Rheinheimera sediminis]|uniref:hypothetical protein n=1 Tax=Rheinheimera sp. YQF-1 TaxID=2499626 RepID=UPI000FDB9510|nr:hypothetical protein [Rheinheimera sp. YQF-1]RVT40511.1 hypothetical protein EMM73_19650 [Rheinheimera sp. YQF-1]
MKIILGALVLSFFSAWVAADTIAKIDSILMFEGGNLVYIYPVGGVQNKPACHGSEQPAGSSLAPCPQGCG